jgi:hypothetical protein
MMVARTGAPVASKILISGWVGLEWLERLIESRRMTPSTERDADESKEGEGSFV